METGYPSLRLSLLFMLVNTIHLALSLRELVLLSLESHAQGFEFSSPPLTGQASRIIQFASLGVNIPVHKVEVNDSTYFQGCC